MNWPQMPTISNFYGILIQMYFKDHGPPTSTHCMLNPKRFN